MQYLSHLFNKKCKNANIKPPSSLKEPCSSYSKFTKPSIIYSTKHLHLELSKTFFLNRSLGIILLLLVISIPE